MVAPGVKVFFPQPPGAQLLPNNGRVVRTTLAGAHRVGKGQPLSTVALGDNATRTPPIDHAERRLLSFVAPFKALDNFHLLLPFPLFPCHRVVCYSRHYPLYLDTVHEATLHLELRSRKPSYKKGRIPNRLAADKPAQKKSRAGLLGGG